VNAGYSSLIAVQPSTPTRSRRNGRAYYLDMLAPHEGGHGECCARPGGTRTAVPYSLRISCDFGNLRVITKGVASGEPTFL